MKQAIVTGAYGAIGLAISEGLAKAGMRVTMVGKELSKLEQAVERLAGSVSRDHILPVAVDLGDPQAIRDFADHWTGELDILINNAATAPRPRITTCEGIEMQWAVNVLGYYRMITQLAPKMAGSPDARIINVASYWAGGLRLDDPEFLRRRYDNDSAYRQSKQADRILTAAFAERLKPQGITINACHPGDVNSKISNDLGFGGHQTPAQGAATPVWLALSAEVQGITGKYFEMRSETPCSFMSNRQEVEALYSLCRSYDDQTARP